MENSPGKRKSEPKSLNDFYSDGAGGRGVCPSLPPHEVWNMRCLILFNEICKANS